MTIKNVKRTITITIAKEFDLNILEATLLTVEEAEKLPERLRRHDGWWWLKSRGIGFDFATYVDGYDTDIDTPINTFGNKAYYDDSKVRPALVISNFESSGLEIGDTFEFSDKQFEIISKDKAFCLTDIGTCAFRNDWKALDANDYEKSDIKKYINEWFRKSVNNE